ncbi:protein o-linked-mannose beta-1 4-n-acetylglucosaminyltransferase 2, partial [Phtheirospermum japonicum]
TRPSIHNLSNSRSDVYEIIGDLRIEGSSSTIYIGGGSSSSSSTSSSWTVKPYARKQDTLAMGRITTLTIKYSDNKSSLISMPNCNRILSSSATTPAIIFSTGGYSGNPFHAFTDILLPLYFTSRQFNRSVLFLVFDKYPGWISKYKLILDKLSQYDVVDMNATRNHDQVLCFPRVIIGLRASHKEFTIDDPIETHAHHSTIMTNFTKLLRSAYSLKRGSVLVVGNYGRPRMLVVCRRRGRHLVNKHEIADMARGLGFEVVLKKMAGDVSIDARLVNSFDVMIGVHGAGLTNMLFLPENAILIQIIPFGLDYIAKTCFQIPAQSMNLRYLEYKVDLNESSLSSKYSRDAKINYTDTVAITKKGFDHFRSVYLDNQDLNIDLCRFRKTLLKALELLSV